MKSTPSSKAPFLRSCHTGEKKGNDIFCLKGPEKLNPGIYQVLNGEGESPSENPGSPHCMLEMAHTRAVRPPPALASLVCAHASEIRSAFSHKESGAAMAAGGAFERPLRLLSSRLVASSVLQKRNHSRSWGYHSPHVSVLRPCAYLPDLFPAHSAGT